MLHVSIKSWEIERGPGDKANIITWHDVTNVHLYMYVYKVKNYQGTLIGIHLRAWAVLNHAAQHHVFYDTLKFLGIIPTHTIRCLYCLCSCLIWHCACVTLISIYMCMYVTLIVSLCMTLITWHCVCDPYCVYVGGCYLCIYGNDTYS